MNLSYEYTTFLVMSIWFKIAKKKIFLAKRRFTVSCKWTINATYETYDTNILCLNILILCYIFIVKNIKNNVNIFSEVQTHVKMHVRIVHIIAIYGNKITKVKIKLADIVSN